MEIEYAFNKLIGELKVLNMKAEDGFINEGFAKAIWTQVSPPISGDLENVEIPTNSTITNKQS